jgi:hypothetical protein
METVAGVADIAAVDVADNDVAVRVLVLRQ